jgi:hypothetical protein
MLVVLLISVSVFSQVPQKISYQGILTDAGGALVPNGNYNILFNIYNTSSGGTALWTETQSTQIIDGLFSVNLGEINPLNLPFDESYWLGITVGAGPELSPRVELTSTAYSYKSMSVVDNAITSSSLAASSVTGEKLSDGAVTKAKIDSASVPLPIAWGWVQTGTLLYEGYGIASITSPQAGEYEITLTESVNGWPCIVATAFTRTGAAEITGYVANAGSNIITVKVFDASNPTVLKSSDFSFIVYDN